MIGFNLPITLNDLPNGESYLKDVFKGKTSGDGKYTKLASKWMQDRFLIKKNLFTTSGTHALEMAAILADIQPGDEVIMPSYTFVSTANAFVLRGANIKFVDIRPDTMNIDEKLIEQAITGCTKVICPVHYAGVSCEMDTILNIAQKYNLLVVEDSAQGMMSRYKGVALGTIGDLGCFSFHETKNYSMGEGGALAINSKRFIERAEIIREKGTNREQFFRGFIDKYSWCDIGSSYLPSEINIAYLYAQLEIAEEINNKRKKIWDFYYQELMPLKKKGIIDLPCVPTECVHNGHIFYIKAKDMKERTNLIKYLNENAVDVVFHYIPLHTSIAGIKFGEFIGEDIYTTKESERLLRLPMHYKLTFEDISFVVQSIKKYYGNP